MAVFFSFKMKAFSNPFILRNILFSNHEHLFNIFEDIFKENYFDLKITLPNYTYSTVEFIAYSGYKQSDSDMANVLDCYRLFSP